MTPQRDKDDAMEPDGTRSVWTGPGWIRWVAILLAVALALPFAIAILERLF